MAKAKVIVEGYYFIDSEGAEHASSTISLVVDGSLVMVVDPGFLENRRVLVDALHREGLNVEDVTVVCITHSHIDHYANMGMFENAKILEYFGIWDNRGRVQDWQARFSENVQIFKTPGHDVTGLTLFVKTDEGVVAICGDVFWKENYPEVDQYASDLNKLERSRELVISMSHWIIPGHAAMYKTQNGHRLQDVKVGKKIAVMAKGNCRQCHRPFLRSKDKCLCQEWFCYRCCQCDVDCGVCRCKQRIF